MGRYYRRRNNNDDIFSLLIKGMIYLIALPFYLLTLIIKGIINLSKNNNNQLNNDDYNIDEIRKANNDYMIQMQNQTKSEEINNEQKYHIKSKTITDNEKYFLDIIKKHFGKDYEIRPQVPLSSIIEKEKDFEKQYQNELYRIIDIGIFNKETSYPLLLIEINDSTHKRKDRQNRDAKVKNICEQAGIKLIAFWTEYSNTEEYIFNRVNTNLRDSK